MPCAVTAGVGLTATPSVGGAIVWTAIQGPLAGKWPHSHPPAGQRRGHEALAHGIPPQRATAMLGPKEPRGHTWVSLGLLDPHPLWKSHGSLWRAADSRTAYPPRTCGHGERVSSGHKEPREVDQALRPPFTWGPCRLCRGTLALFRDLGWDRGRGKQGPTCPAGPSGARPWTAAASGCLPGNVVRPVFM